MLLLDALACLMLITIELLPVQTTLPMSVMSQSSSGCLRRTILQTHKKQSYMRLKGNKMLCFLSVRKKRRPHKGLNDYENTGRYGDER